MAHDPCYESQWQTFEAEGVNESEGRRKLLAARLDGIQYLGHVVDKLTLFNSDRDPLWGSNQGKLFLESCRTLRVLLDEQEDDSPPRAGLLEIRMVEKGLERDHR